MKYTLLRYCEHKWHFKGFETLLNCQRQEKDVDQETLETRVETSFASSLSSSASASSSSSSLCHPPGEQMCRQLWTPFIGNSKSMMPTRYKTLSLDIVTRYNICTLWLVTLWQLERSGKFSEFLIFLLLLGWSYLVPLIKPGNILALNRRSTNWARVCELVLTCASIKYLSWKYLLSAQLGRGSSKKLSFLHHSLPQIIADIWQQNARHTWTLLWQRQINQE